MALTSVDETELLLPLFAGMHEGPRFATFLDRVRARTQADYVGLFFRQGLLTMHEVTEFHSGRNLRAEAHALRFDRLDILDRFPFERLRPERVYAVSEFADVDAEYAAFRARYIAALGIADERIMRLALDGGMSAWMLLARGRACSAADSVLLANLAPYVALALRAFVRDERRRLDAEMNALALGRTGTSWLLLDRDARLIAAEAGIRDFMAAQPGFGLRIGERLSLPDTETERHLAQAALAFAQDPDAPAQALALCAAPPVHALLVPSPSQPAAASRLPVLQLLCRLPAAPAEPTGNFLAKWSGLSQREAELALRISQGRTLAEAAADMGLTLETVRNYSKRIYLHLGLRGQAELVRYVLQSGVSLTQSADSKVIARSVPR